MSIPNKPGDELLWDKVRQAREMSFEDKFLAGPRMFDAACRAMADALRAFMPYAVEADIEAILKDLVAWRKRIEDRPCLTSTT